MTSEHPIEGLMLTAMNSIQDMVDVNTIIGEPIETSNNIVIIPISKVSFGFAAGGSEFNEETIDEYIKKEKERYTRHCRVVRYKSGETYHTRTEYYWTWDYVDHESKKSKKVNFCGNTFSIKKIDIPSSDKIKTIKKSSRIRYVYYGVPAKCIGTIFTELKNGTIEDNNVFYKNMTIEETNNEFQRNAVLPLFWTGWVILSCFIIYGWFYLKNDWLE